MTIVYTHALYLSAHNDLFVVKIQDLFVHIPYADYSGVFLKAGS